jgi:hypothetical protein
MSYKAFKAWGMPGMIVAALVGCATEPTYSPPEHSSATERCPIGEVWVCQDHYPSRLGTDPEPVHCSCRDPAHIW